MRDPLKDAVKAAEQVKVWTERRDDAIRRARAQHSLRVIGEAVGLSHVTVDKIART